jgi:hypothetical protein
MIDVIHQTRQMTMGKQQQGTSDKLQILKSIFHMDVISHVLLTLVTFGFVNIYIAIRQLDSLEKILNTRIERRFLIGVSVLMIMTFISWLAFMVNPELIMIFLALFALVWLGLMIQTILVINKIRQAVDIPYGNQQSFNGIALMLFNLFYLNYKIKDLIDTQTVKKNNEHFYSLECNALFLAEKETSEKAKAENDFKVKYPNLGDNLKEEDFIRLSDRMKRIAKRDSYREQVPWIDFTAIERLISFH